MEKMANCSNENLRNIFKEIFKRFIKPLYIPSLILISLLLIIKSKEDAKYNRMKYLIFLIGFMLIIFSESTLGYIENLYFKNIKFLLFPLISLVILYSIFLYQLKFKIK